MLTVVRPFVSSALENARYAQVGAMSEAHDLKQMKQKRRMVKFARYFALLQSGTSQSIDRKPAFFNER
jgi:hypothetical protein